MSKRTVAIVIITLLFGLSPASANQEGSAQDANNDRKPTKYERFLDRSGSFILSKVYPIGEHKEGSGYSVAAMAAWEMGSSEKIYAARLGGLVVDFDELEGIRQELEKIIQAVEQSSNKPEAASMRYKALNGLEFDYFTAQYASGNPQPIVRLTLRGSFLAGGSMNSVVELRTLVTQAREKLISLGAK
jgi:hypothetical protein